MINSFHNSNYCMVLIVSQCDLSPLTFDNMWQSLTERSRLPLTATQHTAITALCSSYSELTESTADQHSLTVTMTPTHTWQSFTRVNT